MNKAAVQDFINKSCSIDPSRSIKVEWSQVEKKKKKTNINKKFPAVGERPYAFDEMYGKEKKSKSKNGSLKLDQNTDIDIQPWMTSKRADVREVNGGVPYNNEVIERMVKIKQLKSELNSDGSSTITSSVYCTAESSQESSFKTANSSFYSIDENGTLQQSLNKNSLKSERQNKSNVKSGNVPLVVREENQNYSKGKSRTKQAKKNKTTASNYQDDAFTTHRPDITMENLRLVDDSSPETLRRERVARFIQHEEDEDVIHHAFFKEKNFNSGHNGLLRQGIEISHTPRKYFMSIADDDFGFETNDSKN
ncbi:uncharacterized protein LOC106656089 [Trichogramma pretiosum]|uniref:uncharacterized protein LOC106656089 n=1 Tax=Trichogramma pretiosum TaxID=7493 RepID=UPI0006C98539|nr:uncharacterized protein LOC106656089 [Trichogramma pretiosum]